MHHRPAGPPLSARLSGALNRGVLRTRRSAPRRGGRLVLGVALSTMVTGFFLTIPVVSSGSGTSSVALDSSSSGADRFAGDSSAVVLGRDGVPASSPTAAVPPATEPTAPAPAEVPGAASAEPVPPASAPAAAMAASAGGSSADPEADVLALVNAARAEVGCAPLAQDEGLATVARAHSADMRDRAFFDHVNPDGLDPFERAEAAGQTNARAENIAYGEPDPAAVMTAWLDSPGHRANILDCGLRALGVGVAEGPAGPWWTQLFGN